MKLKLKKSIDSYVGTPILFVLGYASRVISLLGASQRRKILFKDGDPILVMKFQGLGSLALAKPGLNLLQKKFPNSKIYFWGTRGTICLAELMPEFHEKICLDDSHFFVSLFSCAQNLFQIWAIKPKWTFDLEVYSRLSSALATLSLAPNRAGFAIDVVGNRKYTHTHLLLFNRYKWIGSAYTRLLSLIDGKEPSGKNEDDFGAWNFDFINPPHLEEYTYIVVNTHSGDLAPEREWPIHNFKILIELILEQNPKIKIILIGKGEKEEQESNFLASQFKENVISMAGKLSLKQTLELLAFSKYVISNDSGPMHLAIAVGAKTLGIFGPTRPESYLVASDRVKAVYRGLYCSPCVHHWDTLPCRGDNQCMKAIKPAEVLLVAAQFNETTTNALLENDFSRKENNTYFEGLVLER